MTKSELLQDLSTKVQAVGNNLLVSIDSIANIRVYDVDVYVTIDAQGTESMLTQRIHVRSEDSPEESASYAGRLRFNYEEPEAPVNGNKMIFELLEGMVAQSQIKSYSFSHTIELAAGTKAGVFTIVNLDDTESQKAFSVIDGQIISAEYKRIA